MEFRVRAERKNSASNLHNFFSINEIRNSFHKYESNETKWNGMNGERHSTARTKEKNSSKNKQTHIHICTQHFTSFRYSVTLSRSLSLPGPDFIL